MGITKKERDFLLSIGICPQCQKRPIEPNRRACYECLGRERDRYYLRKATGALDKKIKRDTERKMSVYYQRKRDGICTKCGKRLAEHGLLCNRCYGIYKSKKMEHQSDLARSERPLHGMCYICGKNELYERHKVCKACYEARLKTMHSMWANMDNSYFRSRNDLDFMAKRKN